MSKTLGSIWTWLDIVVVSTLGCMLQALLYPFTVPFDKNRRVVGRTYRHMGVLASRLTPMWDFGLHGSLPSRKPKRCVVVSNHCSQADPFLISRVPWEMKWLGKRALAKIPVSGWSIRMNGDIFITRGNKESAKEAMATCAEYLSRDMPVFIFPEGTRSKTLEILPFKDGAFRLAIETGAEILPIAVAGTDKALPKHNWKFGWSVARMMIGDYISTEGMTLDDLPALKAQVREVVERMRRELIPLTSDAERLEKANSDG